MGAPYIYDISSLGVNDFTFILITWRKWLAPNNASRQQTGFNSGFKGLTAVEFLSNLEHSRQVVHAYSGKPIFAPKIQ